MTTTRNPIKTILHFASQADKDAELARLDETIQYWTDRAKTRPWTERFVRVCQVRRREVSGWVVGT
jgi:hypothetical protein